MPVDESKKNPRTTILDCASCSKPINLSEVQLIEGGDVICPYCGEACVLEREWMGHSGNWRWMLVENGDDDEP